MNYGLAPSPDDARDIVRLPADVAISLPRTVSIAVNGWLPPVVDQSSDSSCVAQAICYARSLMRYRHTGMVQEFSRHWFWWRLRNLEGTADQNVGTNPRDAMKVARKVGFAPEDAMPEWQGDYHEAPPPGSDAAAFDYRITRYLRCPDLSAIRLELALGNGVMLACAVTPSFEKTQGLVDVPAPGEPNLGGHDIFACGYTDDPSVPGGGYVTIENSWGPRWAEGGFARLSYAFLRSPSLLEAWSME